MNTGVQVNRGDVWVGRWMIRGQCGVVGWWWWLAPGGGGGGWHTDEEGKTPPVTTAKTGRRWGKPLPYKPSFTPDFRTSEGENANGDLEKCDA